MYCCGNISYYCLLMNGVYACVPSGGVLEPVFTYVNQQIRLSPRLNAIDAVLPTMYITYVSQNSTQTKQPVRVPHPSTHHICSHESYPTLCNTCRDV